MENLSVEELNSVSSIVSEKLNAYDKADTDWHGYKKLRVWQKSIEVIVQAYKLSDTFPKTETYGLSNQIRRSSVSVANNIAEGWGRSGRTEFARFIDISIGSLCELETSFEVAIKLSLVSDHDIDSLRNECVHLGRMLHKLRTKLRT